MKKLNLGCYNKILKDHINLDREKYFDGIDIAHDLNEFPYPFKDSEFDEINMPFVLEHLDNTIKVMEEIYRISKNKAIIKISVPYGIRWIRNMQHKRGFDEGTFKGMDKKEWLGDFRFRLIKTKFIPSYFGRFVPFKTIVCRYINHIIKDLYVELEVSK